MGTLSAICSIEKVTRYGARGAIVIRLLQIWGIGGGLVVCEAIDV
ncbi:hypothetical protein [Leptolyngbya sp. UWPOB_LEPTO1]|nr:hypothetical protein [Leptolyngbya sp. UWPOB_LEPTO1]